MSGQAPVSRIPRVLVPERAPIRAHAPEAPRKDTERTKPRGTPRCLARAGFNRLRRGSTPAETSEAAYASTPSPDQGVKEAAEGWAAPELVGRGRDF
eukprot:2515875-Pleurochrysis_carterae.AAC.1